MKKIIILVAVLLLATASFAMTFTRDIVDHVEIDKAIKAEFCRIENPGCDEPLGAGVPQDQAAECLREKMAELDCLPETKEIIYGEMKIFEKNGEGGIFAATDNIIIVDENIYDGSSGSMGYYYINNDVYQGTDTSVGGYYAYKSGSSEKLGGVKHITFFHIRRLDSDVQPYGYEWVDPGYILIYYDRDGTLNMYVHLKDEYYKLSSIKKEVENKTWTPPPEPETQTIVVQTEVEIPEKIEVPTPIPPPPIYLPGMPETADPKKEHVIPNCHSQGASICKEDEECPDKWIKAKEERCCSVICTPVGKKETPPGLEKKNETETEKNETEENETVEENITNMTCPECPEPDLWSDCINNQQNRTNYYCNETSYICEPYIETQSCSVEVSPTEECERVDGIWKDFPNGCVDFCSYARNESLECAEVVTDSCDCGPDRCWNGSTCEPN
jgi:hypothetical protein